MTKAEKQDYLAELILELNSSKSAVFTEYRGTTVAKMEKLRGQLYDKGINYKVAKNSLVKLALKELGVDLPETSVLDQPVALASGDIDEVTMAKALVSAQAELESIIPVAGIVDGKMVSAEVITMLSKLPGREELYGKLVGSLAGLPARMVRTFANPLQGLVTALQQVKAQKEA